MVQKPQAVGGPRPLKRLTQRAEQVEANYAQGNDRPLGGYLAVLAGYAAFTGAGVALTRLSRRAIPVRIEPLDLGQIAVATFQLGRLLTKKPVTSPFRAPFTYYAGTSGPAELHEEVRGDGTRHALGELVTCPFCMSHWVATGFGFALVLAPRATRIVAAMLTAEAVADFLQFAHAAAERSAA
jgi:hypothetical protein